jgi:hypothetical protein
MGNALRNFVLPKMLPRDGMIERIALILRSLPADKAFMVAVHEHRLRRSEQQNRYLWGVCYVELLKALPGWDAEDIHEYMLGECFGWETIAGLGRKRLRPLKRSSVLNKQEFSDFVAFIQRRAAEHGVYIPEPGELAA